MNELMQRLIESFIYNRNCPNWSELNEVERAETLQRVPDLIEHQQQRHKFACRKIRNLRHALTDFMKYQVAFVREAMADIGRRKP